MAEHAGSLSDEEQRRLQEIEDDLKRDDPVFAAIFEVETSTRPTDDRRRRAATVGAGIALGFSLLVVGIVLAQPFVGIIGAIVIVASSSLLPDGEFVAGFQAWTGIGGPDAKPPD